MNWQNAGRELRDIILDRRPYLEPKRSEMYHGAAHCLYLAVMLAQGVDPLGNRLNEAFALRSLGMLQSQMLTHGLITVQDIEVVNDRHSGGSCFVAWLGRQWAWSLKTFGPGLRTIGVSRHIEKECGEVRDNPSDLKEWMDIVILGFDGFHRCAVTAHGMTTEEAAEMVLPMLQKIQDRNFAREWPPIQPEHIPVEHVRTDEERARKDAELSVAA